MIIICKECGYEAPQHADWCSQRMSNIEVCPICRGARGKHSPYCHLRPNHKVRVWGAQEEGTGIKVVFGADPAVSEADKTAIWGRIVESVARNMENINKSGIKSFAEMKVPSLNTSACAAFRVLDFGPTTDERVNKLETELREYKRRLNKLESGR